MDVEVTEQSFEQWAVPRLAALLRFAWLVTGSQHDAEDALQTALAKAQADWERVGSRAEVEPYVRRMIANAHVSAWRRFGRRQSPVAEVRLEPADPVAAVAEKDAVWRVCQGLPRQQRAAVVLRYYEDLDHPEIAEILGCSEVTVRSHLHRALARLRRELRGDDDG
ncbi:SigE family RNA polymerase sigma factor [Nocardioides daejeonensis]|uniref:SigE family RNA polymerase sigma factor n=1 Tax=Nocardioides daejeonensis TaxID=1046556 RepID=UPI001EF61F72|nr:SigE family RNA polymerase sigma factor [Nocardioides daejeonensis]